jgi:hypothetical protein
MSSHGVCSVGKCCPVNRLIEKSQRKTEFRTKFGTFHIETHLFDEKQYQNLENLYHDVHESVSL